MNTEAISDPASQAGFAPQVRQPLISGPDSTLRRDRTGAKVAVITGVILILAGLVKFVFHALHICVLIRYLGSPDTFDEPSPGREDIGERL
jgi:hypothetical protein